MPAFPPLPLEILWAGKQAAVGQAERQTKHRWKQTSRRVGVRWRGRWTDRHTDNWTGQQRGENRLAEEEMKTQDNSHTDRNPLWQKNSQTGKRTIR